MKRVFTVGLVLILCLYGILYLIDLYKGKKENYEFKAFQIVLNESFFPILNDAFDHLDQAADELDDDTFLDWYLTLDGMKENEEYQEEIEETERLILDEEVNGPKTLSLKKNILEQIVVLQETFELLQNAAEKDNQDYITLHESFTSNVEVLSILSEQMNAILAENDDKKW